MNPRPDTDSIRTEQPLLSISLLGHMRVMSCTGLSLLPTGTKTKALLAVLALSNRQPVARTRLAKLLWSTRAPEQARASLRQEIHRLMDILHPLGPEVLDVQRHTLAIRPDLTDIDTEHVLRTTPQTVIDLPDPLPLLLEDLTAVDPAFDLWLKEERNRILDHKMEQLEALLSSTTVPGIIMRATQRLLRLNPLNERAWRARILAAMQSGEEGTALLSADTCIRTFQNAIATTPGQETMCLIADLRVAHHHNIQAVQPAPAPPPPVAATPPLMISATVFVASNDAMGEDGGLELATQFRDELGLDIAMHSVLDVSVQTERFTAPPFQSLPARRQWDFLVGITLTGGNRSAMSCLLQVFDTRLNDTIVWGHRLHITPANLSALSNRFASVLILSLFQTEARRLASKPVSELSPLGLGLRAFTLSVQSDPAQHQTIEHLLQKAEKDAPENQFLFFVHTHYLLTRMYEEWNMPVAAAIQPMVTLLQQKFAMFPGNIAVRYLLTAGLFYVNQPEEARFLLGQMHAALPSDSHESMLALLDGLDALCRGDAETAFHIYSEFFKIPSTVPLFSAPDQEFILSCFLADKYEATLHHARGILATTPDRSAILVPALAAANVLGQQAVAQDYRQRLHRLHTPLSVQSIEDHYAYLPAAMRHKLCNALGLQPG